MHFKWNCDWDEIHVGRSGFPRKKNSTVSRKKSLPRFSLASHLEKYTKHAGEILSSCSKKMCAHTKMAYIQVDASREWFIVWILPGCELDIFAKAVESCLWRPDFPGYAENRFSRLLGALRSYLYHTHPGLPAPLKQKHHRWDFICWNIFKNTGFLSFKSLVSTLLRE